MSPHKLSMIRPTKNSATPAKVEVSNATLTAQHEIFTGPIPPPTVLQGYAALNPDYPERILCMAEKHADADVFIKRKSARDVGRGQVFSFVLGLVGFGVAVLFVFRGFEVGAIAVAVGGVAPIIVAALGNLGKK